MDREMQGEMWPNRNDEALISNQNTVNCVGGLLINFR